MLPLLTSRFTLLTAVKPANSLVRPRVLTTMSSMLTVLSGVSGRGVDPVPLGDGAGAPPRERGRGLEGSLATLLRGRQVCLIRRDCVQDLVVVPRLLGFRRTLHLNDIGWPNGGT